MIMWALLGLLTISSISLHMDGKGRDRRMQGVAERLRSGGNWGHQAEARRGSRGDQRDMRGPENKRGPEKKKPKTDKKD